MTTKIFLVRHAEAEGNLFRVAHGQYDSNLTPRGYRQLAYLRERFRGEKLDAVYGSDLTRAHATASALYIPMALAFRAEPLLREICLGHWEQKTWAEIQREDLQMYIDFNKHPHLWRTEGAETFAQVRSRTMEGLLKIAAENPGGTVAATSHGAALRTLLAAAEGLPLEETGSTGHGDNTAVSLVEVEGERIRVVFRDDAGHLPEEASTFRRQKWHSSDAATEPGLWFRTVSEGDRGRIADAMLDEKRSGRLAVVAEHAAVRITDYELIPALRGQHYGVQLLGQAVQFARTRELDKVILTCKEAVSGYFTQYGFEVVYRDKDRLDLCLDIAPAIREVPAL